MADRERVIAVVVAVVAAAAADGAAVVAAAAADGVASTVDIYGCGQTIMNFLIKLIIAVSCHV